MTKGHELFTSPTEWDIGRFTRQVKHKIEEKDLDVVKAGANAYSHHIRGEDPLSAFMGNTTLQEDALARILENFNMDTLSGKSSLHKGVALQALISKNTPPENLENMSPQELDKLAEQMQQQAEVAKKMEEIAGEKGGEGDAQYNLREKDVETDPYKVRQMQDALKLMARVAKIPALDKGNGTKKIWDTGSRQIHRRMTSMNEATLLNPIERVIDPMYSLNLISGNYTVPRQYDILQQEQDIVLAIDYSGSMSQRNKMAFVHATLMHFAKRLQKGNMVLYVCTFVLKANNITVIRTPQECMDYMRKFGDPNGGGTEVGKVIRFLQSAIKTGQINGVKIDKGRNPEVIILNDGQDYVDPSTECIAPLNAVCLFAPNKVLQTLCNKSGGFYEEIGRDFF